MADTAFPDLTGKTILQVIPELAAGGAERTTLEVAEAIIEAGGRALVVSEGGRLVPPLEAMGGEHVTMKTGSKNPFTVLANARKLADLIGEQGVDLVHARSRAPGWSALWAARRTGTPFVTTYHGAYSGRSALKKVYNSVMARGDVVIANSNWTAAHVREAHGTPEERLFTIPRGVDFEAFNADAVDHGRLDSIRGAWEVYGSEQRKVLLLPGRLTEWKGQLVAVEAMAHLDADQRSQALLILAGDAQGRDGYLEELSKSINDYGVDRNVRIVGHVDDMPAAYAASDIVLAPSTRPEAFGRVSAEASAMGKPVIVADHGGQRETVEDRETGVRVEPGNAKALAAAMGALLALTPEERAAMGEAGRRFVSARYSKRGLQAATLNVYMRVFEVQGEPA